MDIDNFRVKKATFKASNFGAPAPRVATNARDESERGEHVVETLDEQATRRASLAATLRILIPVLLILGMIAAGYGKTPEKRVVSVQTSSSSSNFSRCTLPEGPLGSESTILSTLGALYAPSSRVQ
jgi:hypothetical protein